jgi:hypothetical protein
LQDLIGNQAAEQTRRRAGGARANTGR